MMKLIVFLAFLFLTACSQSNDENLSEVNYCDDVLNGFNCNNEVITCPVSIFAILSTPSCFDKKRISTSGFIVHDRNDVRLYPDEYAATNSLQDRSLLLTSRLSGKIKSGVFMGPDRNLIVRGIFRSSQNLAGTDSTGREVGSIEVIGSGSVPNSQALTENEKTKRKTKKQPKTDPKTDDPKTDQGPKNGPE